MVNNSKHQFVKNSRFLFKIALRNEHNSYNIGFTISLLYCIKIRSKKEPVIKIVNQVKGKIAGSDTICDINYKRAGIC